MASMGSVPPAGAFRYSVVIPVYRNAGSLPQVVARLMELASSRDGAIEAVFVVDGSPDDSLEVLKRQLALAPLSAQLVSLSRNFGSFSAIRTGLAIARGQFIGVMAADLQEPMDVLTSFFDLLERGECDIVLGERVGRTDPPFSNVTARAYWRAYRRFVNREIPEGGVDVFGCTREVAQELSAMREVHTSLIGLLYWVGFRRKYVQYRRVARTAGESAWTFRRKIRYLLDSIYAFTDLPITVLQMAGVIGTGASLLIGLIVLIGWLIGAVKQPGYAPLMIVILASTSAILLGLGIVGSYVWRAYENGKGRPVALIASHEYFENEGQSGDAP